MQRTHIQLHADRDARARILDSDRARPCSPIDGDTDRRAGRHTSSTPRGVPKTRCGGFMAVASPMRVLCMKNWRYSSSLPPEHHMTAPKDETRCQWKRVCHLYQECEATTSSEASRLPAVLRGEEGGRETFAEPKKDNSLTRSSCQAPLLPSKLGGWSTGELHERQVLEVLRMVTDEQWPECRARNCPRRSLLRGPRTELGLVCAASVGDTREIFQ